MEKESTELIISEELLSKIANIIAFGVHPNTTWIEVNNVLNEIHNLKGIGEKEDINKDK